jgi:hypothetical protein
LHLVFVEEEEEGEEEVEAAGVGEGDEEGGRKENKKEEKDEEEEEEENKKGDLNPWRWCCGECEIFVFFLVWLLKYGRGISGEEASGSKTSIREGDL